LKFEFQRGGYIISDNMTNQKKSMNYNQSVSIEEQKERIENIPLTINHMTINKPTSITMPNKPPVKLVFDFLRLFAMSILYNSKLLNYFKC